MISNNPRFITEILASAITPVTLLTGVGFLTSIMSLRFARCLDRIRNILTKLKGLPSKGREYENHLRQLEILYHRTRILRNTMTAAGICILFVVLTIASTFSHLIFGVPGASASIVTFLLGLICLVVLTIGFIYDFLSSLNAVKLEIQCEVASFGVATKTPRMRFFPSRTRERGNPRAMKASPSTHSPHRVGDALHPSK